MPPNARRTPPFSGLITISYKYLVYKILVYQVGQTQEAMRLNPHAGKTSLLEQAYGDFDKWNPSRFAY
jgi:hypothetical protein